jgi:hypothetical protein
MSCGTLNRSSLVSIDAREAATPTPGAKIHFARRNETPLANFVRNFEGMAVIKCGLGRSGSRFKGKILGEIGVRCCLQFNQRAFNHSICFDVARLQISRFRPEPNTFPLGPTLACEAAAVSVCHPAVNSRLPEPRNLPAPGLYFFYGQRHRSRPAESPPDHPSAVG